MKEVINRVDVSTGYHDFHFGMFHRQIDLRCSGVDCALFFGQLVVWIHIKKARLHHPPVGFLLRVAAWLIVLV